MKLEASMDSMEYSSYVLYAAIGIGILNIAAFLFLSLPESRAQIANLKKANAPSTRIAKEWLYSVRYLIIGSAIIITASFGISA
jgi:hypothetical protein